MDQTFGPETSSTTSATTSFPQPPSSPAAALRETVSEAVEFERQEQEVQQSACAIIVVIAVIVGLFGFGIWYYFGYSPAEKNGASPLSSEETKDPNFILAAVGGKIVSPYGMEVTVPPGALAKDKKIEIERVAIGDVTDLFWLKPEGLKFLKPVTVAIPYKERGLKSWEEPGDISLQYWFTAGDRKRSLRYEVDESAKKLKTTVTQF
ncbi:hypothetical protein HYW83_03570 [Candidatus Peregrinibacteria bacterium]|nr:hypothetical protein [Candidatus Peregrinibacteria bacterium]